MKPILINGFPRSGTTYLFRYLKWLFKGKALSEPVTSFGSLVSNIDGMSDIGFRDSFQILLNNPVLYTSPYFYPDSLLEKYLQYLRGYAIKEVTLHLYLDKPFIRENWEVYHIIRHPGDVFLSYLKFSGLNKYINKIRGISLILPNEVFYKLLPERHIKAANLILKILHYQKDFNKKVAIRNYLESFAISWIFLNYMAISSLREERILIYEKSDSFFKLPKFREWIEIEPLKIKKYKAREKYEKKFYKISKKFKISEEFKEIMSLFK